MYYYLASSEANKNYYYLIMYVCVHDYQLVLFSAYLRIWINSSDVDIQLFRKLYKDAFYFNLRNGIGVVCIVT